MVRRTLSKAGGHREAAGATRDQPRGVESRSPNRHAEQLGQTIDENRAEIERRWLERVQTDVATHPGIELTQLRDGLPDYLVALVDQLRGEGAEDLEARSESIRIPYRSSEQAQ
jgi:hypothetical protein